MAPRRDEPGERGAGDRARRPAPMGQASAGQQPHRAPAHGRDISTMTEPPKTVNRISPRLMLNRPVLVDCLFVTLAQKDLPGTREALERTFAAAQAKRVRRTRRQRPGDE